MNNYDDSIVETTRLKVIGAGLCRTGTSSLRDALNILGFRCYHFDEMMSNKDEDVWLDIVHGKSDDWGDVFKGYTATVDYPSVKFYKELMATYPEAKIILTVRDFESWYKSSMETVYAVYKKLKSMPSVDPKLVEITESVAFEGMFNGMFEDKEYVRNIYEGHLEEVKRFVAPEKLLVFHVKEGWSPVCSFLGVPVPANDVVFPHSNDKAALLKDFDQKFC